MLPEIVVLGTEAEMPEDNEVKEFVLGDKTVCVANVKGVILAVDKNCLSANGPLVLNSEESGRCINPASDWRWPLDRGAEGGSAAGIAVYPVKIENNMVVIQFQMADQEVFADHNGPYVR
jgi:nitrite reductase (NADH) small subunit